MKRRQRSVHITHLISSHLNLAELDRVLYSDEMRWDEMSNIWTLLGVSSQTWKRGPRLCAYTNCDIYGKVVTERNRKFERKYYPRLTNKFQLYANSFYSYFIHLLSCRSEFAFQALQLCKHHFIMIRKAAMIKISKSNTTWRRNRSCDSAAFYYTTNVYKQGLHCNARWRENET